MPQISPNPLVTARDMRHALECARRVWLDHYDDPAHASTPDDRTPYTIQRVQANGAQEPVTAATWQDAVNITRDLMAQGVAGIGDACIEYTAPLDLSDRVYTLRATIDRLVRVPAPGAPVYAPVMLKARGNPEPTDMVQLDLYCWLLELLQGTLPEGELWLGADWYGRPRRRMLHEYSEERLFEAFAQVTTIRQQPDAPPVRLESHCRACRWYAACQRTAHAAGNIDLLYNTPRSVRANLRTAGYDSLVRLVAAPPGALETVKGIGAKRAATIRANALAWLERRPVWLGDLPTGARQPGWMFDLETHEVKGRTVPWCMGWCDTAGATHIALVAAVQVPEHVTLPDGQHVILAPDKDGLWEVFAEAMGEDRCPIYHWTGYDSAMLRNSAPGHVVAQLLPRMHDLHATLKHTLSLPLKSTSIKHVSRFFGFDWPGHDDYRAAFVDYCYWLDEGSPDALSRACTYQRADVQSMAHVWRWLVTEQA